MAKAIVGKVHRREGQRERLYTKIECSDCGNITHERKAKRIQIALERSCIHCQDSPSSDNEFFQASHRKDGRAKHPFFSTYKQMLDRCYNENNPHYCDYGGRDIRVCVRWIVDFWAFVEDMGEKPDPSYSIERIDNDGHYDPRNCKWASKKEQADNRRDTRKNLYPLLTDEEYEQMIATQRFLYQRRYRSKA